MSAVSAQSGRSASYSRTAAARSNQRSRGRLSGFGLTLYEIATYGCRILKDVVMPTIAASKLGRIAARRLECSVSRFTTRRSRCVEEELFDVIGIDVIEIEHGRKEGTVLDYGRLSSNSR